MWHYHKSTEGDIVACEMTKGSSRKSVTGLESTGSISRAKDSPEFVFYHVGATMIAMLLSLECLGVIGFLC